MIKLRQTGALASVRRLRRTISAFPGIYRSGAYWWDSEPNFGDALALPLLRWLGFKSIVNLRQTGYTWKPALATVGSLLHNLDHPRVTVWGAGFIHDPVDTNSIGFKPMTILAVRGPRSCAVAKRLGWICPEVFGDPGLFAPLIWSYGASRNGPITFIPHRSHRRLTGTIKTWKTVKVVDPQNSPEIVAQQIATSSVVVSSSLHGLIFAHAYSVPWVWLRVLPVTVEGDQFKYLDFFDSLEITGVAKIEAEASEITESLIIGASRNAFIPRGANLVDIRRDLVRALLPLRSIG